MTVLLWIHVGFWSVERPENSAEEQWPLPSLMSKASVTDALSVSPGTIKAGTGPSDVKAKLSSD